MKIRIHLFTVPPSKKRGIAQHVSYYFTLNKFNEPSIQVITKKGGMIRSLEEIRKQIKTESVYWVIAQEICKEHKKIIKYILFK